jgi:inhibitor of cysteine peptidase
MKKGMALAALFLLTAFAAAGCDGDNVKTYSDAGETVEVKAGNEFVIALESNPTTGYSWMATFEESEFELISDNYEADETEGMVVGSGGTQYLRFKALKAGEFKINLGYQRSWEGEPVNSLVFDVKVL